MLTRGIIDPAKVARSAVENTAAIVSMILTTDALNRRQAGGEQGTDGGGMPGGMGF